MPHAFPITVRSESRDKALQALLSCPDGYVAKFERQIHLNGSEYRGRAVELVRKLKIGWVLKLIQKTRTKEQNDKMWPMLTDLSVQKPLGRNYTPEQWKAVMMRACGHEVGYLHDINGEPFPYGYRSSKLKVSQMCDLIDYIESFGLQNGVVFSEPRIKEQAA